MPYYQGKREGIMLCYPFEEKRLLKWNSPVIVQPKLDGVRCRAEWNLTEGRWILYSSQLNEIMSVPHITLALEGQFPGGGPEFDGELYCHGMSFEEIFSITSRTVDVHEDFGRVSYHIFDFVSDIPQVQRTIALQKLHIDKFDPCLLEVESSTVFGLDQVMEEYEGIIDRGYEGIIVRNLLAPYVRKRSTMMMKFKPKKSDYYTIIGSHEEISIDGDRKGSLGALICSSDEGEEFKVGTGFTHEQRKNLWKDREDLVGKTCKIEYQHITPGRGVPRFPVFVEVI